MKPAYRPDIDGLRAVAVLSVLFYHAGSSIFSGGYVGVDIFFVISGYLITSIIVRDIASNNFSITQFYERRFRRILPALIVVVIASLAVGSFLLNADDLADLGRSAAATSLFSSNILFYLDSGYFDAPAELKPLLHTWSLAVEEQYYIFFPLLLILIARADTRHYLKWLLILGSLSLLACVLTTNSDPSAAFYLIPTRAWELFLGSILAINVLPAPRDRYVREMLTIGGAILIAIGVFLFTPETSFPGIAAAVPTLGTALIIYSGIGGQSFASNVLSLRPMVFVGLVSYSLYLWHWPVLVYLKRYSITELSAMETGIAFIFIFIMGIISWRYVETPFRRKQLFASKGGLLGAAALTSLALLVGGLLLVVNEGLPQRYDSLATAELSSADPEWEHWETCGGVSNRILYNQGLCDIGSANADLSFIYWGDSHARALASGLDLSAKSFGVKGKIVTRPACAPLLSVDRPHRKSCSEFNQLVLKTIAETPEIKTVILAARWAIFTTGTRYKHESGEVIQLVDTQSSGAAKPSNAYVVDIGLRRTIDSLHKLGKNVVLVGPVPEIGYDVPSANFVAEITGRDVTSIIAPTLEEYLQRTKDATSMIEQLEQETHIKVVNPAPYLCNNDYCPVVHQGVLLYRDDDHLSTLGSRYISTVFDSIFEELEPGTG